MQNTSYANNTNITVNGLRVPIPEKSTIKDVIEKFFDIRGALGRDADFELLVSRNSKPVASHRYAICRVKENDILQVISYSKQSYRIHKRMIFKPES